MHSAKGHNKFGFVGVFYYNGCVATYTSSVATRQLTLKEKVLRNEADEVVTNKYTNPNLQNI